MTNYELITYDDPLRMATIVRIQDGRHYVELPLYYSTQEAYDGDLRELRRSVVVVLCASWQEKFGTKLYLDAPMLEGVSWLITDTPPDIDGEVIEGREIDATRSAIEGR